jgi:hypothetical protein
MKGNRGLCIDLAGGKNDNEECICMKKRLLAGILSLLMLLAILPTFAFAAPFSFDAPQNLKAELKYDSDGVPYFELRLDVPQSVLTIHNTITEDYTAYDGYDCDYIFIDFEYKYADYDWNEGPSHLWNTSDYLSEFLDRGGYYEYYPFDSSNSFDEIDIKAETYSFRARFSCLWGYTGDWIDKTVYSAYSNIVTIGNPAYWSNASDWATPELRRAAELGLVPDILKDADMTKPITREEFCELAVLLYEKCTDRTAEVATNPFTDTQNPQILKAYGLGITTGTSATTFSPKVLINREQCATMLYRAIKVISPSGDYSIEGVKDFPDQQYISSWAVEATKYMAKIGIITGNTKGEFMPKATTSAQEATGYGMATREQAIAMSVRTYDKLG